MQESGRTIQRGVCQIKRSLSKSAFPRFLSKNKPNAKDSLNWEINDDLRCKNYVNLTISFKR